MKYKVCAYVKGAMEGGIRTEKSRSNSVITDKSLQWDSGAGGLRSMHFITSHRAKETEAKRSPIETVTYTVVLKGHQLTVCINEDGCFGALGKR